VQSAVCADVARCGSGMSGMWPRGSRTLVHMTMGKPLYHYWRPKVVRLTQTWFDVGSHLLSRR